MQDKNARLSWPGRWGKTRESFWNPNPPTHNTHTHTRQKYELKYGSITVELALFWRILGHNLSRFCSYFCLLCGGRESLAHFWKAPSKLLKVSGVRGWFDSPDPSQGKGFWMSSGSLKAWTSLWGLRILICADATSSSANSNVTEAAALIDIFCRKPARPRAHP